MPLNPVKSTHERNWLHFNAEITGISIMQKVEVDRFWYVLPEEDIIRKKVKRL